MTNLVSTTCDGTVMTVRLNRPEKRNALSRSLIAALTAAFAQATDHRDLSLAILTGSGDKAFASGGDLKELQALRSQEDAVAFAAHIRASFDQIRQFPIPVVALLNGDALGGGAELALACDMRLARAHARIGFLQSRLNIATAWGGGTDLFNILPAGKALRLLCTAEILHAQQACEIGLVDAVAPAIDGEAFVQEYIRRLASQRPQVMRAFKALAIARRFGVPHSEQARSEGAHFAQTWVHDDHWSAVAAMAKHMS
jgi:enoyl-CoA hydratase